MIATNSQTHNSDLVTTTNTAALSPSTELDLTGLRLDTAEDEAAVWREIKDNLACTTTTTDAPMADAEAEDAEEEVEDGDGDTDYEPPETALVEQPLASARSAAAAQAVSAQRLPKRRRPVVGRRRRVYLDMCSVDDCDQELTGPVQAENGLCEVHLRAYRERERRRIKKAKLLANSEIREAEELCQGLKDAVDQEREEANVAKELDRKMSATLTLADQFDTLRRNEAEARTSAGNKRKQLAAKYAEVGPQWTAARQRRQQLQLA